MAASWVLIPCLVQLRNEFNLIAPNRAKGADGSVGDLAHQEHSSDHNPDETGNVPIHDADHVNEVHALDITTDLNESDLTMERCVQFVLARCRRNNSDPQNEPRLRYIIYNRRIWKSPDWKQEKYTGTADPHTGHAHFSAEYDTALEADTRTWHLEDIPVALTAADKTWISAEIAAAFKNSKQADGVSITSPGGQTFWNQGIPNGVTGEKTYAWKAIEDLGIAVNALGDAVKPGPAK